MTTMGHRGNMVAGWVLRIPRSMVLAYVGKLFDERFHETHGRLQV
jgi:hypothetical protein